MLLGQTFDPAIELFCKNGHVTLGKLMLQHVLLHVSTTSPLACAENLHLYTEIQQEIGSKLYFYFYRFAALLFQH